MAYIKSSDPRIKKALAEIELAFSQIHIDLLAGLADGSEPEKRIDEKLVLDIHQAVSSWRVRIPKIKEPYSVHFYNGSSWSIVTGQMHREEAYREWYNLTNGATINFSRDFEEYYHIGPTFENLEGRHPPEL